MSIHAPTHCGPPARPVCAMRTPNGTPQSSEQPLPASRNRRLLAVIATVVIVSVGVGVLVAQFIGGAREGLPAAAASSEPSVTLTTTVEPTATETQEAQTPTPSPSPTDEAIAILANGAIANVSVDALNLRDKPKRLVGVVGQPGGGNRALRDRSAAGRWGPALVSRRRGLFGNELCTETCVDAVGWVATPSRVRIAGSRRPRSPARPRR